MGNATLRALHTPGHTDESTSYVLNDAAVLTGDTLFTNGVGRPDLHADLDAARVRARVLFTSLNQRGTVLDVGAGIGGLTFELLDRGATSAVAVDASAAYVGAARDEAVQRGQANAIRFVHDDFVDVAPQLPSASIVTLDRVVCCYPSSEPLLDAALGHAERCLALSYPRDVWHVRWAMTLENGPTAAGAKQLPDVRPSDSED